MTPQSIYYELPDEHPALPGSVALVSEYNYGSLYQLADDAEAIEDLAGHKRLSATDLSPDQRAVYNAVLVWVQEHWKRRSTAPQVLSFGGYAGTGKSTVVGLIAHALRADAVLFGAYTGRAASVISAKLRAARVPARATTLHSMLYRPIADDKTGRVISWDKRGTEDFNGVRVIIIDEASMVGREMWDDLLALGRPGLAVGDHGQLPPLGRDNFSPVEHPDLRLETVHRQAEGSPIIRLATAIRQGEDWISVARGLGDGVTVVDGRQLDGEIGRVFSGPDALAQAVTLVRFNATRCRLNRTVRRYAGTEARHPDLPADGDALVCLRNARLGEFKLCNGFRGRAVGAFQEHGPDHVYGTVAFDTEGVAVVGRWNRHQMWRPKTFGGYPDAIDAGHVGEIEHWRDVGLLDDFAGAMTVHKAQGSQFPTVVIVEEKFSREADELHRRWLYTAATRARDRVVICPSSLM